MITREEYQFLNEINKGLNLITVSGQNTVLLGKCIESLEQFLMIKKQEMLQYEQVMAQQQNYLNDQENNIPEKEE